MTLIVTGKQWEEAERGRERTRTHRNMSQTPRGTGSYTAASKPPGTEFIQSRDLGKKMHAG